MFYRQYNNLVKYNYIDKSKDTFLGDFNYKRVMYLKNDMFLGIKDSILTVLDGMDLNKLYQYNVNVKAELCFFDSLNNHIYFKNTNNDNIYKKTLDMNNIDTLVSLFKSKEYVLVGDEIDFTNVSIGQYDNIQWTIDENLINNDKHLSHTFTSSGTYSVKLKLTKGNKESTYEKLIPVYDRIKADFDIEVLTEDIPFKVKIINKVKDYRSLYWYLNGKSIDLKNDSTILISEYGEFEIKQFIRDDFSYNETTKKITLYPKVFTQEFKDFKTIKKNKVNIDYFEEQDNFTVTYIEKSNTHFYLVKDNSIFYDYNIFEPVYKHRIPQNPPVGYSESGYEYSMHNNYPILYFNNYDELKYFENTFYVYEEYFYSYPLGYDFTYRFTTDTTKEVITENFIYDIDFNENEMILKDKTKETTIKSNYNKYLVYKDKNQNSILLNNKKYFIQNHQLYYFDIDLEEIYHYEDVFRDLSEYYFAIINSELVLIYKDLKDNWYILNIDENNELIKKEFKYSNEIIIKDIFGLNDKLYLASKNNKIFEYDLITNKEVEFENIELDTIQVVNELKGNLVLFGKKDEFLAYQIINKEESYFNKFGSFRGDFINAKTNNKDKFLAQFKIDLDTINTYLALLDIYSFLDVIEKNFHQIKIINNAISNSEIMNSIYIYDLLGNVVFKEENYNKYDFNFEQLNGGFYLYRIISNEKVYTGKFIR